MEQQHWRDAKRKEALFRAARASFIAANKSIPKTRNAGRILQQLWSRGFDGQECEHGHPLCVGPDAAGWQRAMLSGSSHPRNQLDDARKALEPIAYSAHRARERSARKR